MKLQGANPPRPMTHDLFIDVVSELKGEVVKVTVTELRENTYFAQITIVQDGREVEIDSRPSDAIALAVRCDAQIFAADEVVEESSIEFQAGDDDEVEPRHGVEPRRPRSRRVPAVHRDVTPEEFASSLEDARGGGEDEELDDELEDDDEP